MNALKVLFVEDTASDAELAVRQLKKGDIACIWRRVETEAALRHELQDFQPDVILSDFALPAFGGLEALAIARACAPDVPFVFVSGTIGEERAIEALKRGAVDYVLKTSMARLVPAVQRALEHAALQKARRQQEASIARLTRVLRLLSGTTTAVVRVRERRELLAEACRLATGVGGYAAAVVSLIEPGTRTARPTVWAGANDRKVIDAWASAEWGLDIEITEGALVDEVSSVVSKLRLLRRKGVQVAIDDFGTGYSSLSRLAELPIDMLKIDRTFTSRLGGDATGRTLVSIIIALSKAFGMTTVAEGVETPEQFDLLTKLGCDQSQGYLHSKAVRREELEVLLVRGQSPYVLPAEFTDTPASDAVSRKARKR